MIDLKTGEKKAEDYMMSKVNHLYGPSRDLVDAFLAGRQSMLDEASEGVDGWFLNHNWKMEELSSRQATCWAAWTAARLSMIKEKEELEKSCADKGKMIQALRLENGHLNLQIEELKRALDFTTSPTTAPLLGIHGLTEIRKKFNLDEK